MKKKELKSLLLRALRSLDYGEPGNRHPGNIVRYERAKELYSELLRMYQNGELK
jgi:hypothetical protein